MLFAIDSLPGASEYVLIHYVSCDRLIQYGLQGSSFFAFLWALLTDAGLDFSVSIGLFGVHLPIVTSGPDPAAAVAGPAWAVGRGVERARYDRARRQDSWVNFRLRERFGPPTIPLH
jgi:hypothetical protein